MKGRGNNRDAPTSQKTPGIQISPPSLPTCKFGVLCGSSPKPQNETQPVKVPQRSNAGVQEKTATCQGRAPRCLWYLGFSGEFPPCGFLCCGASRDAVRRERCSVPLCAFLSCCWLNDLHVDTSSPEDASRLTAILPPQPKKAPIKDGALRTLVPVVFHWQ